VDLRGVRVERVRDFGQVYLALLMLAAAFTAPGETRGRELILRAYTEAVANRYRFFSYGDAMLLV
jgi:S-adenosylmethionine:tRNA ribosyltransferase-isomerase